ncbi:YcaO-like family protein [Pseudonocardia sp. N23]|uniref:YcaO-like family protein n=1 Tax=Pseudonocardia sp. N23 TaxID=1987376 RepID=UPI000BFDA283|nr:YcaO-like family protein [Pseudonocardia sp. N23]GAY09000.1 TOMM biosynthesis docking scaffold [Pseudonocardia sp. N23]
MADLAAALADRRTGLLVDVGRLPVPPGLPSGFVSYGALVGRTDRFTTWRADATGFGASLGDEDAARAAAIGEAIERYCGNAVPDTLRRASHAELVTAGEDALDPATLALYSARQYRLPGFPFVPFTADLRVGWVHGTDLHHGEPTWVPASLAHLDYVHGTRADEPPTHSLMYSGIAAGTDRAAAERSALEELLERDATGIWWASGAPATGLDDGGRVTGALGRPAGDVPLRVHLTAVPSEFDVPVVAALVEQDGGFVGFGSACRADPAQAAAKALVEALGLLRHARDLADPDSLAWAAVASGTIEAHAYLPFRADRRYADDTGPGHRALTDLPGVAQLYLDPRMQGAPLDPLRPAATRRLDDLPDIGDARAEYLRRLAAAGIRVVSVDLTTPDVRAAGWRVVRVVAAGLIGNGPPAFPLRGSARLHDVPARLGWPAPPRDEDDLVDHPLPLA